MSVIAKCLFKVTSHIRIEKANFPSDIDRELMLRDEMEDLWNTLPDEFPGHISFVHDNMPDISKESTEFILGSERPEELKKAVSEWNRDILKNLVKEMRYFEDAAKRSGYERISDFFESRLDGDVTAGSFGTLFPMLYPASLDDLGTAISATSDGFVYGQTKIVLSDTGNGPLVDRWVYEDVSAHPEKYAIAEVIYD